MRYKTVNSKWPDVLPALDAEEAISAAKRIYRKFRGHKWRGKWKATSGNRFTWPSGSTYYVNPARTGFSVQPGWHDLVHMMSHYIHHELHPTKRPHDTRHEYLEREMIEYIVGQGWLDGRLKPKPKAKAKPVAEVRHARVLQGIERWTTKLKRAQTALRKLNKQKRYYERKAAP